MDFRVLGPVEVLDAEAPVPIAGVKQRLLLALLLAEAGRRVSRDSITEALWPDRPPGDAAHALDVQVSRLRKAIGAERVLTSEGGYRIDLGADGLDAQRFDRLVDEGRLEEALALWRGSAFGELGGEPALRAAAGSLEDRRGEARERLLEAKLERGRHEQVLRELEALATAQPLRERAHQQLMVALYRSGRQADALRVYDDLRRRLAEELGIDPGEATRGLHEAIVRQDPSLRGRARPTASGASRRIALAAVAAAAVVGLLMVVLAGAGEDGAPERQRRITEVPVPEETLAFVDLRKGQLLGEHPIAAELTPEGGSTFAQGRRADWLATASGALLQIDPRRHRVARSISLGFNPAGSGLAVGLGSVWVAARDRPLLVRLDPVYGSVQRRYRLPTAGIAHGDRLSGLTIAAGSVWVTQGQRRLVRLDPRAGRVKALIPAAGAESLAGASGAVWMTGGHTGVVYRVDVLTNRITARVRLDPYVCCVAVGGGFVWAMNHRVWKLSSDGNVISSIPIDGDGANLLWTGGALWASEGVSGRETRIDPADDSTKVLHTGGLSLSTGIRGNVATVVVGRAPPDLLAGVRGPVARIDQDGDPIQPADPALASYGGAPLLREQVLDATCARLMVLRRTAVGWKAVPELARSASSADGRTWRFPIRPGFRFSPPSNAPVTAGSMRYTIERALSPRMGSGAAAAGLLSDLTGLRTRGASLVVQLRRPAYDLPLRMSSRAFCAVPEGMPPSATRFTTGPIPSAGPYYLSAHYGGTEALVRRNPNYGGERPQRFAAFLYEMAVSEPAGVDRVSRGRAELVVGGGAALAPHGTAARTFSAGAGAPAVWSQVPLLATHAIGLRTSRGPLADARLRHAVRLALDRALLAKVLGDQPTADLLPTGVPGSVATPVARAQPARARALVGNSQPQLTFGDCHTEARCRPLGELVSTLLARAGIVVRVRPAAREADLTLRAADMTSPNPLDFLAAISGRPTPAAHPAPTQAAELARRWDAKLTAGDELVAFGTPMVGQLISRRVGCRSRLPFSFGYDLAALCAAD
jgi:DNA-binding SARP family transcriptional activator